MDYNKTIILLVAIIAIILVVGAVFMMNPFKQESKIDIVTPDNHEVEQSGILCVAWDRDAVGVYNYDRRTTTKYNGKAEFYNYWHKVDCGYFADKNENFVVFYVANE